MNFYNQTHLCRQLVTNLLECVPCFVKDEIFEYEHKFILHFTVYVDLFNGDSINFPKIHIIIILQDINFILNCQSTKQRKLVIPFHKILFKTFVVSVIARKYLPKLSFDR